MVYHLLINSRAAGAGLFPYALALLVLLCTTPSDAQSSYTSSLTGIDVTVKIDRTRIVVGEPVALSITMENVTPRPVIDVSTSLQLPEGNDVEVNVQPPGELEYRYAGALEIGSYPARPMTIVRGVPQKIDLLLLYDRTQPNGYLFSKPGTYRLSGEVRLHINNNPDPDVAAIPVTHIEVLPPEGVEAEVFSMVDEPDLARSLHLGVTPTTAILEALQPVAQKYPKTPLGALALRAVGQHLSLADSGARDRGAAMLQQYLANGIVPVDGDYTAWVIAAAYHLDGKYDLAREWIYYTLRHYPHSVRIRPQDALFKYYYFDPADFASQVPWYLLQSPWKIPGATPPASLQPVKVEQ